MNSLQILDKSISMLGGLYSLNDLHRASGGSSKHQPSNFMRLDTTQAIIEELESECLLDIRSTPKITTFKIVQGGDLGKQSTYVCKELVYSYAMWVNAVFQIAVIRAFDAMQLMDKNLTFHLATKVKEYELVDCGASNAGRQLNRLGKHVKPRLKAEINALLDELQPSLDFVGNDHDNGLINAKDCLNNCVSES